LFALDCSARSGLDNGLDSNFPRSATGTYVKLTVYLPHEEGSEQRLAAAWLSWPLAAVHADPRAGF